MLREALASFCPAMINFDQVRRFEGRLAPKISR
jgi:hypothetical protein